MISLARRAAAGGLLALVLAVPAAGAGAASGADAAPRLTVTGEGEVAAAPDMATVRLAVSAGAASAGAALARSSQRLAAVLDALAAAGVAARDIRTTGLSLAPRRRDEDAAAPAIRGYTAENGVRVRVRDLDALGGLLDDVVAAGANRLSGLSFGLSDRAARAAEARRAAVRAGRAKARDYAAAAGVRLGALRRLEEAGGGPAPARMATTASVPVATGAITVTARVRLVYAITGPAPSGPGGAGPGGDTRAH